MTNENQYAEGWGSINWRKSYTEDVLSHPTLDEPLEKDYELDYSGVFGKGNEHMRVFVTNKILIVYDTRGNYLIYSKEWISPITSKILGLPVLVTVQNNMMIFHTGLIVPFGESPSYLPSNAKSLKYGFYYRNMETGRMLYSTYSNPEKSYDITSLYEQKGEYFSPDISSERYIFHSDRYKGGLYILDLFQNKWAYSNIGDIFPFTKDRKYTAWGLISYKNGFFCSINYEFKYKITVGNNFDLNLQEIKYSGGLVDCTDDGKFLFVPYVTDSIFDTVNMKKYKVSPGFYISPDTSIYKTKRIAFLRKSESKVEVFKFQAV